MADMAANAAANGTNLDSLESSLNALASQSYIPREQVRQALVLGWGRAVSGTLEKGLISETAETALTKYARAFGLTDQEMDTGGARNRLVRAAVLREVINGKIPSRVVVDGSLPFNLLKTETLVWLFNGCSYYEDKVHTRRVGGYQGVSLRIMKGVYYRVGGFQGHPVETHTLERIDAGTVGVTSKHLYFAGHQKSFRIPYTKVVSFDAYSDGIGIHRDGANARPQLLITGDGWFTYNLVTNLAKLA
jgi:hypothetical protein